ESLLPETFLFRSEGEKAYEELKKQIKKLGKKDLSCNDAQDFYGKERVKVKALSKNLVDLLAKVK
nr:hypothetical protein [Bdellovibrionales bacterium]